MIRLLHAADMHLNSAFTSNLGAETARLRRSEQLAVFSRIIQTARERADVLLIAGDLFDSENVSQSMVRFLKRKFAEISDIPVFIAAGNHDPYTADSVYALEDLGDNVHVFSADGEYFDLDDKKLRICGVSFGCRDGKNVPKLSSLPKKSGYLNIAVIHGDATGAPSAESYNRISVADIENSEFDYIALGHIHVYSGINKSGNVCWAYPGIPEPRGFDECAERGGSGVIYAETDGDGLNFELIDLHERLYHTIDIDVSGAADSERVVEMIEEKIACYSDKDLFKITLAGRTPAGFRPNAEIISKRLKQSAFFVKIIDQTETERSLNVDENDSSLRAEYIKMLRERISSAANDNERRIAKLALNFGVDALDGVLE